MDRSSSCNNEIGRLGNCPLAALTGTVDETVVPLLRDAHGHHVEIEPETGTVRCAGDGHVPHAIVDIERAVTVWKREESAATDGPRSHSSTRTSSSTP